MGTGLFPGYKASGERGGVALTLRSNKVRNATPTVTKIIKKKNNDQKKIKHILLVK